MSLDVSLQIPHELLRLEANINYLTRQKEALTDFQKAIIESNDPQKRLKHLKNLKEWEVVPLQSLYRLDCIIAPLVNEELIVSICSIISSSTMSIEEQNSDCELRIKVALDSLVKKIAVFHISLAYIASGKKPVPPSIPV